MKSFVAPRVRAAIALGGLILFFGCLVLFNEMARRGGVEIVLETRPIDPRDAFFGHYAILGYRLEADNLSDIADGSLREAVVAGEVSYGDEIYLAVEPDGVFHRPALLSINRTAALAAAGAVLSGRISYVREGACDGANRTRTPDCGTIIRVVINGLPDRYYAERAIALDLEERVRRVGSARQRRERWRECIDRRTALSAAAEMALPPDCEEILSEDDPPAAPADAFGVILSVVDGRDPILKGILLDGEPHFESLFGTRRGRRVKTPSAD